MKDLLAQRELEASARAWTLARTVEQFESTALRVAFLELRLECADVLLGDFGEHRDAHQQPDEAQLRAWLADCETCVKELRVLREAGASNEGLLREPFGTREWFSGLCRGVEWRTRPQWLPRLLAPETDE